MNALQPRRGRLQLVALAAVFLGPLLLSYYIYLTGQMTPVELSNYGELFDPIISIQDELPGSALHSSTNGRWVLLYTGRGECDDLCRESLYRLRQTQVMVARDMDRIVRVFLHGDTALDTAFLQEEHPNLITINDKGLKHLLEEKRPDNLMAGGIYLIDPYANLVMYFPPGLAPMDLVHDVKHLLKLSRIG